jgi:hypothetical protein
MYLHSQSRKKNGKTYTYYSLAESYREGKKSKKKIISYLGQLTPLQTQQIGYFWGTHPDGKIRTFKNLFVSVSLCFNQWWEVHFCDLISFGNKFSL